MLLSLGLEVHQVEIAIGVHFDRHDLETSHSCRLKALLGTVKCDHDKQTHSRVGSVGTKRNQADVAMTLSPGFVVGTDDAKPSVLSCGTGIGLQRRRMEASDPAQVFLELLDDGVVTLDLIIGDEGVDIAKLGPCDGDHAARAVQLHRAASEGDHGVNQSEVLRCKVVDVAQHLGLRMVFVEHRVRQVLRRPLECRRD